MGKRSKIRFEYKVFIFFMTLFLLYLPYHFFLKEKVSLKEMSSSSGGASSSKKSKGIEYKSTARTIEEAIKSERPITFSEEELKKQIEDIGLSENDVLGIENANESSSSTIWVYMRNDGLRKDDIAMKFCAVFRLQGATPKTVMIMDAAERKKGKIIELGEARCF